MDSFGSQIYLPRPKIELDERIHVNMSVQFVHMQRLDSLTFDRIALYLIIALTLWFYPGAFLLF